MTGVEVIDPRDTAKVYEFVRAIENGVDVTRIRLELDHSVSLPELMKAIASAGLVVSSLPGGVQLIHRFPKEAA